MRFFILILLKFNKAPLVRARQWLNIFVRVKLERLCLKTLFSQVFCFRIRSEPAQVENIMA